MPISVSVKQVVCDYYCRLPVYDWLTAGCGASAGGCLFPAANSYEVIPMIAQCVLLRPFLPCGLPAQQCRDLLLAPAQLLSEDIFGMLTQHGRCIAILNGRV